MPRTQAEVIEGVEWLAKEWTATGLREKNEQYRAIRQLTERPVLADELTRNGTVTAPSPRISDMTSQVTSQISAYSSFPILTALEGGLTPSESDSVEQAVAVWLAEANEGAKLDEPAYFDLLNQTHSVWQLRCGAYNGRTPFSVHLPPIDSVYFEPMDGVIRPPLVARDYWVLTSDVESTYSGTKTLNEGRGKALAFDGNKGFRWGSIISNDKDVTSGTSQISSNSKFGHLTRLREFHDGEYSYVLATPNDPQSKPGNTIEVYREKCVTGGLPPFIVLPGNVQRDNDAALNWRPIFWPLYVLIKQINRKEAIRSTRSESLLPHVFALLGDQAKADVIGAVSKLGFNDAGAIVPGGPNVIDLKALDVKFWTPPQDNDTTEQIAELTNAIGEYVGSWRLPVNQTTVSQANVGTVQLSLQVVHQRESELTGPLNRGKAELARMMLCAAKAYANDFSLQSPSDMEYGERKTLKQGSVVRLSRDTLAKVEAYGPKYNVRLQVVTRSETEQEQQMRGEGVFVRVQRGYAPADDYISVFNPNVTAVHEALAEDLTRKQLAAKYDAMIEATALEELRLEYGIDLSQLAMSAPASTVQPMPTASASAGRPAPSVDAPAQNAGAYA